MSDLAERISRLPPERRALLEQRLLRQVDGQDRREPAIGRRAEATGPLSFAQERLWFLDQWQPGSPVYNVPLAMRIRGPLNVPALEGAVARVLARHESLRTVFVTHEGVPQQRVLPALRLPVEGVDVVIGVGESETSALGRAIREVAQHPFDLEQGPLLRLTALRLGPEDHLLLTVVHHIVFDGWSSEIFFRELGHYYSGAGAREPELPPLPIQYADFAWWQRQMMTRPALAGHLDYWKRELAGAPAILEVPADFPRPALQGQSGARERITLSPRLAAELHAVSRLEGATLFMTLLAGFGVLMGRWTSREDLIVGTAHAGRVRRETEPLIGCFVNTVPLRVRLSGNPTFRDLVAQVRQTALSAQVHGEVPFEMLVRELVVDRDPGRVPLIQAMLVLHNTSPPVLDLPGLDVRRAEVDAGVAKVDLVLALEETPEGLRGNLTYSTDLFRRETAARLVEHFREVLEYFAADPQRTIEEMPALSAGSRGDPTRREPRDAPLWVAGPQAFVEPATPLEQSLARAFAAVLGVERVGVCDDFFELGGHSLAVLKLLARVRKELGSAPPVTAFFRRPTIRGIIEWFDSDPCRGESRCLLPIQPGGALPPLFCVHSLDGWAHYYAELAARLGPDQPLYGLQAVGLDGEEPIHTRVEEMAAHYLREIRAVQPIGPYYLGGLSGGGTVAFEMAQQLHAAGEEAAIVAMFDTWAMAETPRLPFIPRVLDHLRVHFRNLWRLGPEGRKRYIRVRLRAIPIKLQRRGWLVMGKTSRAVGVPVPAPMRKNVSALHLLAHKRYRPRTYPGRITLFRAAEDPVGCRRDPERGWTGLAAGGIEVHEVPGSHGEVINEPFVPGLAEKLTACIEAARLTHDAPAAASPDER